MVFSSAVFLFVFFPLTLLFYFVPSFKNKELDIKKKNFILCISSLIFYAWGEPVYIILMLISIFFNYNLGLDIDYNKDNQRKKKALIIVGVVFNLFLLGFFKYWGFVLDNINSIFSLEIEYRALPLPVGISFYTFQILSYIIDVYNGKAKAQNKLLPFACYITMFPQLIAGPIVQYSDVERQLQKRTITTEKTAEGIVIFIRGLGKKVLFANTIGAVYSDVLTHELDTLSVACAWIGILAYTMQIYFDFSGYSDMAIGLGKMLGFEFLQNFNFPYKATSVTDFWRRWHMSLSSWFRDYVYIPLGGNRKGTARTIVNLLIVWSLTGLWHGAAWNFLAWGVFYGILLILEKYVFAGILRYIPKPIKYIATMCIVMIGWVFFSSESFLASLDYISAMFNFGGVIIDDYAKYLFSTNIVPLILMSLSATGLLEYAFSQRKDLISNVIRYIIYGAIFILCILYLISETYNPFLYFRF